MQQHTEKFLLQQKVLKDKSRHQLSQKFLLLKNCELNPISFKSESQAHYPRESI